MKIIIADDSSLIRERIKELVLRTGVDLELNETDNGQDAFRMIRNNDPDLVFLDIRMPGMSGIEILKRIREYRLRTEVCILTSYPFPPYRTKCLELGAEYFLDKNMEFGKIEEIILNHEHIHEL